MFTVIGITLKSLKRTPYIFRNVYSMMEHQITFWVMAKAHILQGVHFKVEVMYATTEVSVIIGLFFIIHIQLWRVILSKVSTKDMVV